MKQVCSSYLWNVTLNMCALSQATLERTSHGAAPVALGRVYYGRHKGGSGPSCLHVHSNWKTSTFPLERLYVKALSKTASVFSLCEHTSRCTCNRLATAISDTPQGSRKQSSFRGPLGDVLPWCYYCAQILLFTVPTATQWRFYFFAFGCLCAMKIAFFFPRLGFRLDCIHMRVI